MEGKKMGATSDMMDRLMQTKDKEGRHLSDEEVVDNVLSNIAISYFGIAYPVTWSMYFLAKNPYILQKLREENMEMAREKNGVDVTYEDFLRLKYTNKVVEETIRIASISGFVFKKATEDIKFEAKRVHRFLLGLLPSVYGSLRSVLLSQTPLPTLHRAFHLISQEERVRGIDKAAADRPLTVEASAFVVRSVPSSQLPWSERQKLVCSHCNRKGHDRSMCFDLMDELPDGWYELRGISKPGKHGSGRGGSARGRGGRGGGRTGGCRGDGAKA
ncbi:hypothetical protein KSS87_010580 [Heliosperma pusillum]|nr:hypothetical protein KSS87_010580 [Heliosperma pusillum]